MTSNGELLCELDKLFKIQGTVTVSVNEAEDFLDQFLFDVVAEVHSFVHLTVHPVKEFLEGDGAAVIHVDLGKVLLVVVGHHSHEAVQVN